jgi:glucose-6-phosphate 1-dehydrogenase
MSDAIQPTILVIVGITGDLSQRKLLPAIREIAKAGVLPEAFRIVGISRRPIKLQDVVATDDDFWEQHLELRQMDLSDSQAYHAFAEQLQGIERSLGGSAQRLFYLSVPPDATQSVVQHLGDSGLAEVPGTKLLLEKPFGTDLASAQALVEHIAQHFKEDQVYRIDHYLAKEMAQNLIVFRAANPIFAETWNNKFISSIEVTASEKIGIEGRSAFYEQTGALRDVVQSHLLQLAALTLMELPKLNDLQAVPRLRCEALSAIEPAQPTAATRAQYDSYKEEVSNPSSPVETFVSLTLQSKQPSWEGVPIRVTTGKALKSQYTEIRLNYRGEGNTDANTLVLRVQPDEGVQVCLWVKKPGYENALQQIPLSFDYKNHFTDKLPDAYERVFIDAMRSDHSLFTTSQEVLASWQILAPLQAAWQAATEPLPTYPSGSPVADVLKLKS